MKLGEKAEQADQPEVKLARQSAPGLYVLTTDELTAADEITPEGQFPKFGDFLEVGRPDSQGNVERTEFIECPAGLAGWIVGKELSVDESFRILDVWKDEDGSWEYNCRFVESLE